MIVPIIFGIWFGRRASKAGRSGLLWGLGGALMVFVVTSILVNLVLLAASPFSSLELYLVVRVLMTALGIVVSVGIGRAWLPGPNPAPVQSEELGQATPPAELATNPPNAVAAEAAAALQPLMDPAASIDATEGTVPTRRRTEQLLEVCPHCRRQVLFLGRNCPVCNQVSAAAGSAAVQA